MMIWIWYGKCPWCTRRCGGHRICPGGCRRPGDAAGGAMHPCVQAGEVSRGLCGSSPPVICARDIGRLLAVPTVLSHALP